MEISDYAIGTAVLNQFQDARVFHTGGSMLVGDLRQSWSKTGLRARDLRYGIEALSAERAVILREAPDFDQSVVSLLPYGSERLSEFRWNWTYLQREFETAMTLRRAARRLRPEVWLKWRSRLHHFDPERAEAA